MDQHLYTVSPSTLNPNPSFVYTMERMKGQAILVSEGRVFCKVDATTGKSSSIPDTNCTWNMENGALSHMTIRICKKTRTGGMYRITWLRFQIE